MLKEKVPEKELWQPLAGPPALWAMTAEAHRARREIVDCMLYKVVVVVRDE